MPSSGTWKRQVSWKQRKRERRNRKVSPGGFAATCYTSDSRVSTRTGSLTVWFAECGPSSHRILWSFRPPSFSLPPESRLQTGVNLDRTFPDLPGSRPFRYFRLSDYLEIPNLRWKSFRYIGSLIERLLGLGSPLGEEISRREQGIYLVYGLVAIVSSFSILAYIIATAGGYLIENRRPEAV